MIGYSLIPAPHFVVFYNGIECICKKLRKGKNIESIAEELEEEIYDVAKNFAPEYNVEEILKAEQNK